MTKRRALVIGLDGGTFRVLRPLAELGYMPTVARLMRGGSAAPLRSIVPHFTPPAWTSFMTGRRPGRHGILSFRLFDRPSCTDVFANSSHIQAETIWEMVSRHGGRVVALNVPMTYPPFAVNGAMVSGFETPSMSETFTYPETLRDEIFRLQPDYDFLSVFRVGAVAAARRTEAGLADFCRIVRQTFAQRTALAAHLLDGEWDLAMVHFQETDLLQHVAWPDLDPETSPAGESRRRIVWDCYRELDQCIEQLVSRRDVAEALVMIVSDHGFGPGVATVFPNAMLWRWGFLDLGGGPEDSASALGRVKAAVRNAPSPLVRGLYGRLVEARSRVQCWWPRRGGDDGSSGLLLDGPREKQAIRRWRGPPGFAELVNMDRRRTSAFVPLSDVGAVYLNRRERQPYGTLTDAQADTVASELVDRFSRVRDASGRVFPEILPGDEVFAGCPDDSRPDLVLIPREGVHIRSACPGTFMARGFPGDHRTDGVLVLHGPGVEVNASLAAPSLVDVAPTILAYLGLPVPGDLDGTLLQEGFTAPLGPMIELSRVTRRRDYAYGAEAEAVIERRLRDLGYLE